MYTESQYALTKTNEDDTYLEIYKTYDIR